MHRMTSENDQRDRQDENWSMPTNMEERNNIRQEPQGIAPGISPSEGRFTNWSSLGSPHARTVPHDAPNREIEQSTNQPDQHIAQSGSVPMREEAARNNSQEEVIIPPRICQQPDEQSAQMIDTRTNTLNIEVRPQELRMQENLVIPQLDGLPTIPGRNQGETLENIRTGQNYPHDGTYLQRMTTSNKREYLGDSSGDNRSYRSKRYPNQRGRPPDEGRYPDRDRRPPRRRRSQDDGRPLMEENPLMVQDPLMMEDPLMEMEDPKDALIEEDHQDLEDLLDQKDQ